MKRNLIELQHSQTARTLAQLNTLIHEPEMVCTILAISPEGGVSCTTCFNALIVHDQDWYLLRCVPVKLLHHLLPQIEDVHRVFFINEIVQNLASESLDAAANCLVSLQPCLLCEATHEHLYTLATPFQGFAEMQPRCAMRF